MTRIDPDALAGFNETTFDHAGTPRAVYRSGHGPGVVVVHEAPGITPKVADFARRVVDAGFTVAMPSLFGTPGRPMTAGYALRSVGSVCISREFSTWALRSTSPVIEWLRALARALHEEVGGPGVGAVGMCMTGGFALAMAVDDTMLAPVCAQPSLPFAVGKKRARDLGVSDADLARVKERAQAGLCVLGLRFSEDRFTPGVRFERVREELGDRFVVVEIDSSGGNPHGIPKRAHSVLAHDFVDEPGHPTRDALDRVIAFLRDRLQTA